MPKSYKTKWIDNKQVRLRRWLMEQHLGCKLTSSDLVHHKNGDIHDNRIENLEVVSRSKHKKLHPEIGEKTRFKQIHFISRDELKRLYIDELLSIRAIAKLKKMSQPTLLRIQNKYGIKRPEIKCEICQEKANYIKARRCYKCYLKDWHKKN